MGICKLQMMKKRGICKHQVLNCQALRCSLYLLGLGSTFLEYEIEKIGTFSKMVKCLLADSVLFTGQHHSNLSTCKYQCITL